MFLAFIRLAAWRTLSHWLLACLNFTLDSENLFCRYRRKGNRTNSWKAWIRMRLDLIFKLRDIYINSNLDPFTIFTSSRGTEFKVILPWKISQMIIKTVLISTRRVISYAMKQSTPFWVSQKVDGNWGNKIFHLKESHYRKNTSVRRNPKRAGLCESQSGIWVGKLTIWVRSLEIKKIITEFTTSISSTRID